MNSETLAGYRELGPNEPLVCGVVAVTHMGETDLDHTGTERETPSGTAGILRHNHADMWDLHFTGNGAKVCPTETELRDPRQYTLYVRMEGQPLPDHNQRFVVKLVKADGSILDHMEANDPVAAMMLFYALAKNSSGRTHGIGSYVALVDNELQMCASRVADTLDSHLVQFRKPCGSDMYESVAKDIRESQRTAHPPADGLLALPMKSLPGHWMICNKIPGRLNAPIPSKR